MEPTTQELKILFLEDSADDAELAARILQKAGLGFTMKLVDTEAEYVQALKEYHPDIVLADHSLFQFSSSEALKIFRKTGIQAPFILVTGTVSEEFAVEILKEGADDYLLKNNLVRLPKAVLGSLEKYRLAREKQKYIADIIANDALMKEAESLSLFGSWEASASTGEMHWSDGIYRICGYEPGSIKPGQDIILYHIHPADRPSYQRALYLTLPEHDHYTGVLRLIDKQSVLKYISVTIGAKRSEQGELTRIVGFMQDVTAKTEMEKELSMQSAYRQKLTAEVTIQAQEKERNEIGKELHDNINQVLATIGLYLKMALDSTDTGKKDDLIRRSAASIYYSIEEIRKLSKTLVAPALGEFGLSSALRDLAEDTRIAGGPEISIEGNLNDRQRLEKNLEIMLYRVVQEQVNNIRKYANASKVVIYILLQKEILSLTITDNGNGFDPSKKAQGIGLRNIRSRTDYYSGTMEIISSPGNGCRLEIKIPLEER